MDEITAEAFVDRQVPMTYISAEAAEELADDGETVSGRQEPNRGPRSFWSKSNIKERVQKATGKVESSTSIQDRLLDRLLQQVIPIEDLGGSSANDVTSSSTARNVTERPNFNVTTMSNNFRRFNARIGVIFVFQARVLRLLSWKNWSHTLSFLAVYTFVCLDPYLLSVLPLAILLLAIFIPSFITRHPAAPTTVSKSFEYSPLGPPIAPARTVRPAKELSKDFFHNMRDLQNSMEDFSRAHDKIVQVLDPLTNFSNEPLSSTLFFFLCIACAFMFIASHLVPWRLVFLVAGWFVTCASHPNIQPLLIKTHRDHIVPHEEQAKSWLDAWIARDIILDSEPETREVEIFELQKISSAGEWEPWLFSVSPYDPLSPGRITGDRPKGTHFFEDVQAPKGWEWSEKKWVLDLWSREWVEERIITGVEVETEGERWVYDIEYEKGIQTGLGESPSRKKGKSKQLPSWEEVTGAMGRRGAWRRRRWVRTVKRRYLSKPADTK